MIFFRAEGTRVYARATSGYPISDVYWDFVIEGSTNAAARLVAHNLNEKLLQEIRSIKTTAYEAGWKEGRSHHDAKRTGFSGAFDSSLEKL